MPVTDITILGKSIQYATLSTALAGATFTCVSTKAVPKVVYLYGPGRMVPGPNVPGSAYVAGNTLPNPLPAGQYLFKARDQGDADALYHVVRFDVANVPAAYTPSVPAPQVGASASDTLAWTIKGACFSMSIDCDGVWPQKAVDIGITHLRSFADQNNSGSFNAGSLNAAKRMLLKYPTLHVIGMHGMPEGPKGQKGVAVYPQAQWDSYWQQVAAPIKDQPNYLVELQNEINDPHYFNAGQSSNGTLDQRVVDTIVMVAKSARQALGAKAYIIGPSIGWDAGPALHLQYAKAMIDAGILDYISAWNTHCYMQSEHDVSILWSGLRSYIGNNRDLWATETRPTPLAACAVAMKTQNVRPCAYRLMSRVGRNDKDCLYDAVGNKAVDVLAAWGY